MVIFLACCLISLIPVWRGMEWFWIKDATSGDFDDFPVLVKSDEPNPKFRVGFTNHLNPAWTLVTIIDDNEIAMINRDLRSSISKKDFNYDFYKIVDRQNGYIDVSIEMPTLKNSKIKGWYRIQKDKIYSQKYLHYGPGFAIFVAPFILCFGLIGVYFFDKILRAWQTHRLEVTAE